MGESTLKAAKILVLIGLLFVAVVTCDMVLTPETDWTLAVVAIVNLLMASALVGAYVSFVRGVK